MSANEPQPTPKRGLIRRALRKWWLPILTVWLVGSAALGAGVYTLFKPMYRASSLLRVDSLPADLYGVRGGGQDMETFLAVQVQLITSPNVLTAAATDPKVVAFPRIQATGDVVQELKKVIGVGVIPGTSLIEVAMTSESPYEAAALVNAVVKAFIQSQNEWSGATTRNQVDTLEEYMRDLQKKSDEVDRQWRLLLSRDDAIFIKGQDKRAEITLDQLKQVHKQLFDTRIELAIAEAWALVLKAAASNAQKNPASPADEALLTQQVERRFKQDPEVVELASQLEEAKARLDEISKMVRAADDPAQQGARNKLKALEARHEQLWETKSRQIREQLLANRPNPDGELLEAESRARFLGVRMKALQGQLDQLEVKNRRRAADEVDLALIHEQRDSLRTMKEAVNRRLEQLNFETKRGERIRLFNPATTPGAPIGASRSGLMALIPIVVFPVAFAFFLGVEAMSGPSTGPAKEDPPAEV